MLIVFSFTRNCNQPECNSVGEICPSHGGHHFMEAIDRHFYRARRTRGIERALSPTSALGVFAYSAARVPDRVTAEDLTSEVFLQMV